jgi:hypothetical protein
MDIQKQKVESIHQFKKQTNNLKNKEMREKII